MSESLPNSAEESPQFITRPAEGGDLVAAGRVYARAFPDSLHQLHSRDLRPEAVADLLAAVQAVDRESVLVAEAPGRGVVGYIVAPANVAAISRAAWRRGLPFVLLWRWARGRYGLSARGLLRLLRDRVRLRRGGAVPDYPAHVLSVAVDPAWQSKRIGRALTQAALERFRRLGIPVVRLEVRPDNAAAQRLYHSLGFRTVGETRDSRGTWVVMLADLTAQRTDEAS